MFIYGRPLFISFIFFPVNDPNIIQCNQVSSSFWKRNTAILIAWARKNLKALSFRKVIVWLLKSTATICVTWALKIFFSFLSEKVKLVWAIFIDNWLL